MKRLGSDDSLGALISICPTTGEHSPGSTDVYNREFQSMLEGLDEEGCIEESVHISEKKRRLSVDQVKALEKNFEIENKLEPERKVRLAQELGLQPRQVAVWFQNRRARWKTKQLERDYGLLKASYDALKLSYESLQHENDSLLKEVRDLKSKLDEESGEGRILVKEEEMIVSESENNTIIETEEEAKLNYEGFNNALAAEVSLAADLKDGSSDSDSSAILQEERSPVAASSSFQNHHHHHQQMAPAPSCFAVGPSSHQKAYQPQFVKMEEHNFFGAEEPCNFFSDDPAPTLQWYCSDQWI